MEQIGLTEALEHRARHAWSVLQTIRSDTSRSTPEKGIATPADHPGLDSEVRPKTDDSDSGLT